jgi:hypothetical protein
VDKGVTSMEKELGGVQDFEKIKELLKNCLADTLGIRYCADQIKI